MVDREFLLMEAIRRLDTAYHQLWGAVCETYPRMDSGGKKHFEGQYQRYADLMQRIADGEGGQEGGYVTAGSDQYYLRPPSPKCNICRNPNCDEPNGKH